MRWRHLVIALAAAAVAGLGLSLAMVWSATTVERAPAEVAAARFDEVRRTFGGDVSLLVREPGGTIARRASPPPPRSGGLARLSALAYDAAAGRLVAVEVPFWFFKLKAPAVGLAFRDTGFDFDSLGITASDLEAQGPCILFDEITPDGDRVLVWTQ